MLHDPRKFGRRHIGWELRAIQRRRREARRAAILIALGALAAFGCAIACDLAGDVGAAAVLGIAGFGALIIGAAVATEA